MYYLWMFLHYNDRGNTCRMQSYLTIWPFKENSCFRQILQRTRTVIFIPKLVICRWPCQWSVCHEVDYILADCRCPCFRAMSCASKSWLVTEESGSLMPKVRIHALMRMTGIKPLIRPAFCPALYSDFHLNPSIINLCPIYYPLFHITQSIHDVII